MDDVQGLLCSPLPFGFAVLLYNAWLPVDFFVQVGVDVESRTKPRITAERFRRFLKRRLDRFI